MKGVVISFLLGLAACTGMAQVAAYVPPTIQSLSQISPTGGSAGALLRFQVLLRHGTDPKPLIFSPTYSGGLPSSVESSTAWDSSYDKMDLVMIVKSTSVIGAYKLEELRVTHSAGYTIYKRDGTIAHQGYLSTGLAARHTLNFALADFSVVAPGGVLPPPALTPAATVKLYPVNMSAIVPLQPGSSVTIGFVISGSDTSAPAAASKLLVRAVGPGLTKFGVGSSSTDPRLTINATTSITVDNWNETAENTAACEAAVIATGAFPLDRGSKDAAIVVDVPPGALTVSIRNTGAGGDILVEVYRIP
ncbi:MAG: hypothetical protein HZC55_04165 [Verrucomicrobia bacterium]|nr:hypothetical protein [Verrucomicrobiota bacterium]